MTAHTNESQSTSERALNSVLLERYWLKETSPEEAAVVEEWFSVHPEWRTRYEQLRHELKVGTWIDLSPDRVDRFVRDTLGSKGNRDKKESVATPKPSHVSHWRSTGRSIGRSTAQRFGAIGVGLSLALLVAVAWPSLYSNRATSEQVYTTGTGQRITVALTDGSRVILAPKTTVRVASSFGTTTRSVSVQGEAHFDVIPVTKLPFVVQAGKIQTRVLGTRFVVKSDAEGHQVVVAVEQGKVAVERLQSSPVVLTAGRIVFVTDSETVAIESDRLSEYTDWVNGRLTFQRAPLPDALTTLGRWYGVQFRIADSSLVKSYVTGTLPYGSLDDMLMTLKNMLSVSLSYEREKDGSLTVILRSPSVEQAAPSRKAEPVSLPTLLGR